MSLRYSPDRPPDASLGSRCFLAFEDRGRDITGLLEYGTVAQLFAPGVPWQITPTRVDEFVRAVTGYFSTHGFNDGDFIVAIGDPVVVAVMTAVAARFNRGSVTMLKWDRIPCPTCGRFKNPECHGPRDIHGRYVPIRISLDSTRPR